MTEETKKKISETIKRKWQDEKYREKVVNSHKHKLPEEWKENIRKATNNMTEETKSKMSKSQKKRWENLSSEERIKISNSHKGKKHSNETKKKISNSTKESWEDKKIREERINSIKKWFDENIKSDEHKYKEYCKKQSEKSKKFFNSMSDKEKMKFLDNWIKAGQKSVGKTKKTSIEKIVEEQLKINNIKYTSQKKIRNGHFILDFWLPEYQLAIECNGEYWHNLPKRKERDKKLEKYIIDKGKDILWLWENDIKKENFDISDFLEI